MAAGDPTPVLQLAVETIFGECLVELVMQFFGDFDFLANLIQGLRSASGFAQFAQTVTDRLTQWDRPDAANIMIEAQKVNGLFLRYDTNRDGFISAQEFSDFAKDFLGVRDPLDVSRIFAMVDTNHDGET